MTFEKNAQRVPFSFFLPSLRSVRMESATDSEVLFLAWRFQDVSVSATFPFRSHCPRESTNERHSATVTGNLVDFTVLSRCVSIP